MILRSVVLTWVRQREYSLPPALRPMPNGVEDRGGNLPGA